MIGYVFSQPEKLGRCFRIHSGGCFRTYGSTQREMESEEDSESKTAFSRWKYRHYFKLTGVIGKNVHVECTLCPGRKPFSTSCASNSNLMKHLSKAHASTKLVAREECTGSREASVDEGPSPCKQQKLDFSTSAPQKLSQTELYGLIGRYVVENMLPISTVESDSFRALISKIPRKVGVGPPCRKTFSKYIDTEYARMNAELKKEFEQLEYLATTADIWTAHNKSFLGVTAHWMHPENMKRKKAALACRRFKGRHTHESIATELALASLQPSLTMAPIS